MIPSSLLTFFFHFFQVQEKGENAIDPGEGQVDEVGMVSSSILGGVNEVRGKEMAVDDEIKTLSKTKGSKGNGKGGRGRELHRAVKRRDHWANQLCTPEWMLTVPSDLNGAGSTIGAGELNILFIDDALDIG